MKLAFLSDFHFLVFVVAVADLAYFWKIFVAPNFHLNLGALDVALDEVEELVAQPTVDVEAFVELVAADFLS